MSDQDFDNPDDERHEDSVEPEAADGLQDEYKKSSGATTSTPFLTPARERELWARRHEPAARDEILEAHFPLCKALAAATFKNSNGGKIPLEDYEAEARLEMVLAYDKYDPDNEWKARFCSYAGPRIKHALREMNILLSGPVKLATTKEQRSLYAHWGYCNQQALREDASRTTHARQKRISTLMAERTPHKDIDTQTISDFEGRMASRGMSLNAAVRHHDEGSATYQDFVAASYGAAESNLLARDHERQQGMLQAALTTLDPRARDVISKRLLCEDSEKATLWDLADTYNVSAERIRQIELSALKKLRAFMTGDVPAGKKQKAQSATTTTAP